MIVNINYVSWKNVFGFPTFSLNLDTLEINEAVDNVETIVLDNTVTDNMYEFYEFKFTGTNQYKLSLTIVSFEYNNTKYTLQFWESNGLERVDIDQTDEFGNPTTIRMPEYIQVSNNDDIITYKIFTRYQDTYYYKGILFGDNRQFWISFDMYFKARLLNFSFEYLKILIDNMTQPFYSKNLHILYNFITSCFRDPQSDFVLLPPVMPLEQKENTLI